MSTMLLEEQKEEESAEAEAESSPGWIERIGRVVDRLSRVPNTQYESVFRVVSPTRHITPTPDEARDLKLIAVQSDAGKQ